MFKEKPPLAGVYYNLICCIKKLRTPNSELPLPDLFRLHTLLNTFSFFFIKQYLSEAYNLRRYFYAFVLLDIFHAFFKRHLYFRNDTNRIITTAGAHVGEFL